MAMGMGRGLFFRQSDRPALGMAAPRGTVSTVRLPLVDMRLLKVESDLSGCKYS